MRLLDMWKSRRASRKDRNRSPNAHDRVVLVGGAAAPSSYCVIVAAAFTLASGALYLFDGTHQLDSGAAEHKIRLPCQP